MTSTTPSLVLFDLDGVLVEYDRAARVRHLADAHGVSPDAVWQALFGSGLEDRFDAGAITDTDYLDALGEALGATVTRERWAAARGAAMRVDDATPALLERLATAREIALLTNNGGLLLDVLPELFPSLTPPFGGRLLCSERFGVRKPDPAVYRAAVAHLGHAPEDVLFLDDSPANVEGARRAGLGAAHVARPAALRDVLAAYGLG